MKIRVDKRDAVFSLIVRLKARYVCEACGRFYPKGHGLQASHFYGRRHKATRWSFDNCAAHCFSCHRRFTENPLEFTAWVKKYLGDTRYDELTRRHAQIVKRTKAELEELYQHLKSELKALEGNPNHAVVGFD